MGWLLAAFGIVLIAAMSTDATGADHRRVRFTDVPRNKLFSLSRGNGLVAVAAAPASESACAT